MSRVSSRANKEQFTSASVKIKSYSPKPAPKQPKPPAQALSPAPTADVAIPAILFDSPNNGGMNEKFKMLMNEETAYWKEAFHIPNGDITNKYCEVVECCATLPASMQLRLGNLDSWMDFRN